eukprot:CAMPEP_0115696422 /NCGR_PEP_ID=MMETSP0272-20121206/65270_1 /TAXON_ID=71861 /ORGANISM="Scrippsiella trochoidea, Strain CCMP3099" /LENGTH=144 /DNA_ID=CAMNT_0003136645 /DNA_START=13 /DNA_END=445 /DNA_ORIENTATION=-
MANMEVDATAAGALPLASRVNFQLFQQAPAGAAVRVGGRLAAAEGEAYTLATTDGGSLRVLSLVGPPPADAAAGGSFVEVVGTKVGTAEMQCTGLVALPAGGVDTELWDEAVKLMQAPQLRDMFQPSSKIEPRETRAWGRKQWG